MNDAEAQRTGAAGKIGPNAVDARSSGNLAATKPEAGILEVKGLTKVYPGKGARRTPIRANDSLSLTVREGELVALLGPNGAGKSTFLKQVSGQLLPTAGTIVLAGVDMIARPRAAKEYLSAVPQESEPWDSLTVEEQIRAFARIKGVHRGPPLNTLVEGLLELLGLKDRRSQLSRELSGGYKRRLLLAIGLASTTARLLLLDEPTTGLDPEARHMVWRALAGLRGRGLAILLTTHYIEEAERLADRVVIIDGGKFVRSGTPDEIKDSLPYQGKMDLSGLGRVGAPALAKVRELEARWPVTLREDDHVRLSIPDPFAPDAVGAFTLLSSLGVRATLAPVTLEDAYLECVGAVGS